MRPVFESGAPVPAFLNKLWKMVDDEKSDNLICWSPGGNSFLIKHQGDFCAQLLPQFYKHSNMASFVRQLNMYGFHKVSNIENGGLRGDKEEIEFIHSYFKRGEPKLVEHIKRKMSSRISSTGSQSEDNRNLELMNKALEDVAQMKGRQMSMDAQLATMKQHNVALWRELSILRRKHHKQQQIVNKLIQFLLTMVNSSRSNIDGLGVKRRYPLMLHGNDSGDRKSKIRKQNVDTGPTIHELDNVDDLIEAEAELLEICIDPTDVHNTSRSSSTNNHVENSDVDDSLLGSSLFSMPAYRDDPSDLNFQCVLSDDAYSTKKHSDVTKKGTSKNSKSRKLVKNLVQPAIELIDDNESIVVDIPNVDIQNPLVVLSPSEPESELETEITEVTVDDDIFADGHDKSLNVENSALGNSNDSTNILVDALKTEPDLVTSSNIDESSIDGCYNPAVKNILSSNEPDADIKKQLQEPGTSKLPNEDMKLVSLSNESILPQLTSAEDLDSHLETMQTGLESLKDLLVGDVCSIDANTLLGLFETDDPMTYSLSLNQMDIAGENTMDADTDPDPMVSGSELAKYAPSFDMNMFDNPIDSNCTPESSLDYSNIFETDLNTLNTPVID